MRALVQRVGSASVSALVGMPPAWTETGGIGAGLCALVGITHDDTADHARRLADRVWQLRILDDAEGRMNRSLAERHAAGEPAEVLVVSQFTLYGELSRGRRPSWVAAARPEHAEPLVDLVAETLAGLGAVVATGRFRTRMKVSLVNDGPVTLMLEV